MANKRGQHPWAKFRRAAGFTQEEAADRIGVTRRYMIMLEQSLYWHPPDSTMIKLAGLYQIELGTFEMAYYEFVRTKREEFAKTHESFKKHYESKERVFSKIHPLVEYRTFYELTRMGFCKALCLHYDPISEYEHNKQRHVPDQLKAAFEEINWDWTTLGDAVSQWRRLGYADVK